MAEVVYPTVGYGIAVALDEGTGSYNYAVLKESGDGLPVKLSAEGENDNISITIEPKGTGTVQFGTNAFNYLTVTGGAMGVAPRIAAEGGDTNINIEILPKGFQQGTLRTTRMLVGTASQWAAYQGAMTTNSNLYVRSVAGSVPSTMAPFNTFYMQPTGGTLSGTQLGAFNAFQVVSDSVKMAGAGGGYVLYVSDGISAGVSGNRVGVTGDLNATGQGTDTGSFYYVGVYGNVGATAPQSASGTAMGHLFGANFATRANTGANNWFGQTGIEIDVRTQTGASSQYTYGLTIVHDPSHAVQGTQEDVALAIGDTSTYPSAPTSPGWRDALIRFGGYGGYWGAASTCNLIDAVQTPSQKGGPPMVAAIGIDFARVKFGTDAMRLPGMSIGTTGTVRVGSNTVASSSTGLTATAAGKTAVLSSIAAAGSGYIVGETLNTGNADLWQVATVDGSGGITGLTLLVAPTITSGAAPANPQSLSVSPNGTGATINLTWTDAFGITLAGTAGTQVDLLRVGSGGPTITTGSGVPATTTPKGSLYLRTGGAVGSTLYVSQGGGTWNAVAGV